MVIKSVSCLSLILGMVLPITASLASVPSPVKNRVNSPMQISLEFPPAPKGEGPVSTAGGGTRSPECKISDIPMTALVPSKNTSTVSANPTFFVYIPEITFPQSGVALGEFVLVNNRGKDVYLTTIQLPLDGSIVQIALPKTVALEVGKQYKWLFSMKCQSSNPNSTDSNNLESLPNVASLEVYIQRNKLTPTLERELEKTQDPLKKAEIYVRENLWQDTLMIMAQLRDSQQEEWKSLLNSIKIEESIIEAPFAPEPTVSNSDEQSAQ
ncbi:conserved exported hypothetical protein [Planktothrix serta PCC 8927]|uniref:DUF928 domain-containing protein n=1 Tax=Planktothrix serta PCC 8927 TaxID=671068 RepID=A0A7Z9BNS5_9CYAN|nr:DUF928 domain-containing protein [Planktothrix serta]VXD18968.1 conserved exported hypothetical protein [Planktothrix serta PCC 8927]